MNKRIFTSLVVIFIASVQVLQAQESVARQWNEALLAAIRKDFGKPTVQARNIFHTSMAMYDAWAAYDNVAETFLLGKTVNGFTCPFNGIPAPANLQAAREQAVSFAAYRVLRHRFLNSPGAATTLPNLYLLMAQLGYDTDFTSTDYSTGSPAALGNYVAQYVINFGFQDGSNEPSYSNLYYAPVNPSLIMVLPGNPNMVDPNRWQPLTLTVFIDQNGNIIPGNTPPFLSPEWGNVTPFSLTPDDLTVYQRDGHNYNVYHDPGSPPLLDTTAVGGESEEYKWSFALVSAWSSHLDPGDGVMWDISPGAIGNIQNYPTTLAEYHTFYDLENGGTPSPGRAVNPKTGLPYAPQIVPRGDYTRVLAEFWADGPNSETPPGHWFTILNYVTEQPAFERRFRGQGPILDPLEFDVKAYFTLAGTMHDVAVTVWGMKGWYDYVRPVSAIRYMAKKGQSSDAGLPSYHPAGIHLMPGLIELVEAGDPLAGANNVNVGKIKLKAWRGPNYIVNPQTDVAGVDWILADNWWPYQRPTFVSPPFAGYISGHSTYSSAAAETLTALTGDPYFPGGMGVFPAPQNQFLVFEDGPSVDMSLQWATYKDASDQCSLSRIWGGIHPPVDDIPGRFIGQEISTEAFQFAENFFYNDEDGDGYFNYVDCNDNDASVHPGAAEVCDGIDNDCNDAVDDGLQINTYFVDSDGDSFGNAAISIDTCLSTAPAGYVTAATDCDDNNAALNPGVPEVCDGIDNDCNSMVDDGLQVLTYYLDSDGDSFGNAAISLDTCLSTAPAGYVTSATDCDDNNAALNPGVAEVCDDIDNDCNGMTDDGLQVFTYYADSDNDSYGQLAEFVETCEAVAPAGYAGNSLDCDDNNALVNPGAAEVCDDTDNNCDGQTDEGLQVFSYYTDIDGDTFGDALALLETCENQPPAGYVLNNLDCDDANASVNPNALEVIDGVDNDCNGLIDDVNATTDNSRKSWKVYPNPVRDAVNIYYEFSGQLKALVYRADGKLVRNEPLSFSGNVAIVSFESLPQGVYIVIVTDAEGRRHFVEKVVRI